MGMMLVSLDFFVRNSPRMRVQMKVPIPLMLVFVRVDGQCFAQGPRANAQKHDSHQSFSPGG